MITVRVELDSASDRSRDTEIARIVIANIGGTQKRANYEVVSYRGRDRAQLDQKIVARQGKVHGFQRKHKHVLNLVAKALAAMEYGT